ncbi:MAG: Beta-ketoadipate enol-lactone hydrolase [Myxococcaceae bacterium]|nr:Beta-ketoadipate enol-lactone hydrolase [Myxococcaceae bacterium]
MTFAEGPDGTRLFYESDGAGPAVILCDGIACEGFIWRYLQPALAPAHRVLHFNYRGHGRSGPPLDPARVGVADHARDLHRVLDHAGVDRAVVVAHSMGTQVALEAWRQRPAAVAGLVLVCGSYGLITRTFHGSDLLAVALPKAIELQQRYPGLMRALWSRGPVGLSMWVARALGEVDSLRLRSEDLAPYFEHVVRLEPGMFLRMLAAAGAHTAEDLLPEITAPALIVAGERDTFTPVRYAEQLARQIHGATFLRLDGASHTAPLEQPERLQAAVLAFLDRVYGDGA